MDTVNGILAAGLTSVTGALVYLWREMKTMYAKIEAKLDECETDRLKLHEQIAGMLKDKQ